MKAAEDSPGSFTSAPSAQPARTTEAPTGVLRRSIARARIEAYRLALLDLQEKHARTFTRIEALREGLEQGQRELRELQEMASPLAPEKASKP